MPQSPILLLMAANLGIYIFFFLSTNYYDHDWIVYEQHECLEVTSKYYVIVKAYIKDLKGKFDWVYLNNNNFLAIYLNPVSFHREQSKFLKEGTSKADFIHDALKLKLYEILRL